MTDMLCHSAVTDGARCHELCRTFVEALGRREPCRVAAPPSSSLRHRCGMRPNSRRLAWARPHGRRLDQAHNRPCCRSSGTDRAKGGGDEEGRDQRLRCARKCCALRRGRRCRPSGAGRDRIRRARFSDQPPDILFCRGNYRLRPPLPATPGAECVGRVVAVGSGVTDIRPGDLVANMQRENWVQRRRISASDAIPLPTGLDPLQAAMLRINPATALLLLEDHVTLKPGDWVIQNVANSAVGRHLIVLAKEKGARTLNVVRRDDVAPELKALGADVVLNDGPDLPARARDAAQGAPIRLGIDAVSGEACKRIADSVADGGVVVTYGSMSGADPVISRLALGRGITLKSFMLGDGLAKRSLAQVRAI